MRTGAKVRCDGVTARARMCSRPARVALVRHDGSRFHACYAHDPQTGGARARMLAPYAWEVDGRVVLSA